jgi:hypothetical protein
LPLKADIESMVAAHTGKLGLGQHCLRDEVASMVGFDFWCNRIKALPDYFIEETIREMDELGFPSAKGQTAVDFLKSRRDGIDSLVTNNIAAFPKLPPLARVVATVPVAVLPAAVVPPKPSPGVGPAPNA